MIGIYHEEENEERRSVRQRAEGIAACVKIYCAHMSPNFPYREYMEFSLTEELERLNQFLMSCRDTRFANEIRKAMRLLIHKTARIPAKTLIATA